MKKKNLLIGSIVLAVVLIVVAFFWFTRDSFLIEDRVGDEIELIGTVTELPQKTDGIVKVGMNLTVNGEKIPVVVAVDFSRGKISMSYLEEVVEPGKVTEGHTVYKSVAYEEFIDLVKIGDEYRMTFWLGNKSDVIARQTKKWLNLLLSGNRQTQTPDLMGLVVQMRRVH